MKGVSGSLRKDRQIIVVDEFLLITQLEFEDVLY